MIFESAPGLTTAPYKGPGRRLFVGPTACRFARLRGGILYDKAGRSHTRFAGARLQGKETFPRNDQSHFDNFETS